MMKSRFLFFKLFLCLISIGLLSACSAGKDSEAEIKEKVRAGEFDEAVSLAYTYLGDDKRVLLVMLEYITYEKSKAEKEAYKEMIGIEDMNWTVDAAGSTIVTGRFQNRGKKMVTGLGVRMVCRKEGKTSNARFARYLLEIYPGTSAPFFARLDGLGVCQDLSIHIVDLGLREEPE